MLLVMLFCTATIMTVPNINKHLGLLTHCLLLPQPHMKAHLQLIRHDDVSGNNSSMRCGACLLVDMYRHQTNHECFQHHHCNFQMSFTCTFDTFVLQCHIVLPNRWQRTDCALSRLPETLVLFKQHSRHVCQTVHRKHISA